MYKFRRLSNTQHTLVQYWNKMILELEDTLMFIYSRSHNWFAFPKGKDGEYWKEGVSELAGSSQLPAACKGKAKISELGQNLGLGTQKFIYFCLGSKPVRCCQPQPVYWLQMHGSIIIEMMFVNGAKSIPVPKSEKAVSLMAHWPLLLYCVFSMKTFPASGERILNATLKSGN